MTGRVLLAEGREAEVFDLGDGTVLKLFREPSDAGRAEREAMALRTLASVGVRAPAFHEIVTIEGRPGLITERIVAGDLLAELARNPLRLNRAAKAMAQVHVALHELAAPAGLPDVSDVLRGRIESAAPLPDEQRVRALAILGTLPRGDRLCHGDLHLGNLLGSWSDPVAIDWGDAARGDPLADVARTEVLHRVGEPPPGAPWVIRRTAPIGRGYLARRYLVSYRKARPFDRALLQHWRVVRAAARLDEPIPEEHPRLLQLLRRWLGPSERTYGRTSGPPW